MRCLFLVLAISAFAASALAQGWQFQEARFVPPDGEEGDYFGYEAVALDGDFAVFGALWDDNINGSKAGAAYVYHRNPVTKRWYLEAKLLAFDGASGDYFGTSVAISETTILVGADGDDDGGARTGSVYAYRRDPATGHWAIEAKLKASDRNVLDYFGETVVVSGHVAVIGASGDDDNGEDSGSAYVFRYDPAAATWIEEAKLLAPDGKKDDGFYIVAVDGDVAVVGALGDDDNGEESGSAYAFRYHHGSKTWIPEAKLLAPDGSEWDRFGWSVSISGDSVLIGACADDDIREDSGSAYIFRFDQGSGKWQPEAKLHASDSQKRAWFGNAVSICGSTAAVGAEGHNAAGFQGSGAAYLFHRDPVSGIWSEEARVTASDCRRNHHLGHSIALSGDTVIAGAYGYDGYTGSACVFRRLCLDVEVNGTEGGIIISSTDNAVLNIEIEALGYAGTPLDVWVLSRRRGLRDCSCAGGPGGPTWRLNWDTAYATGSLTDYNDIVLNRPLFWGSYEVWLALDKWPDGVLNGDQVLSYDHLEFNVVP